MSSSIGIQEMKVTRKHRIAQRRLSQMSLNTEIPSPSLLVVASSLHPPMQNWILQHFHLSALHTRPQARRRSTVILTTTPGRVGFQAGAQNGSACSPVVLPLRDK